MEHWTEIRTAARVARLGTVTAAAESLGVHRATINRHIDTLEAALGGKLFQRHSRGFTPTDLGEEMLRIANTADEQFEELHRKALGNSDRLKGEFIVTSIPSYAQTLLPVLKVFGEKHQDLTIRFLANDSLLRLEYGEAHVAFRVGNKPQNPDNIVRAFETIEMGLYAHQSYVDKYGLPKSPEEFPKHRFAGLDNTAHRATYLQWLQANIPADRILFRSSMMTTLAEAVLAGTGLGFLPRKSAVSNEALHEVIPPQPDWHSTMWLVTHVDLHKSAKVQAFMEVLRQEHKPGYWF